MQAAGKWKYYSKGFKQPFYYAFLNVMECDTCPKSWKHKIKPADSLEFISWVYGKTDTVVRNGDTMYVTPELIFTSEVDISRVKELSFTLEANGDILMNRKVYRRAR